MALQVMFTGINLPKRYVSQRKLGLTMLLLGVMTSAWFVVGLLIWGLIPGLSFVEALVVGSILTPTGGFCAAWLVLTGRPCSQQQYLQG